MRNKIAFLVNGVLWDLPDHIGNGVIRISLDFLDFALSPSPY